MIPILITHSCAIKLQLLFLNQRKKKNCLRNIFMKILTKECAGRESRYSQVTSLPTKLLRPVFHMLRVCIGIAPAREFYCCTPRSTFVFILPGSSFDCNCNSPTFLSIFNSLAVSSSCNCRVNFDIVKSINTLQIDELETMKTIYFIHMRRRFTIKSAFLIS